MTGEPEKPKRPRWRKKRWIAAGLLWLAVCYPLSIGPAVYAFNRGWMTPAIEATATAFYFPLEGWGKLDLLLSGPLTDYIDWAGELGERHAAP